MQPKILLAILCILFTLDAPSQRNVILIIADDLGTDYCGFYEDHNDTAILPNLRRLLPKAVRFTNAMSNPVCSPTRAGLLTGRYSFRTSVGNAVGGVGSATLDTSEITIPRILKQNMSNIATANIGKWHLHNQTPASNLQIPNLLGYDYYAGNFTGTLTSYTNWTKVTNGSTSTSTNYATTETTNDAIAWIKTKTNTSFFLWLAYNAPHTPLHLPPSNLHTYTGLTGTTAHINANPKLYFKAMLQALDHEIGRLFDSLTLLNKWDSTDIVFIGDNGNGIRSAQIANTNRAKGTVYQYGVHVPFIISGPTVTNPNRVSNQLVNTHDLFATIIELFNINKWKQQIPPNTTIDSKSILPILQNKDSAIRPWAFTEIFKVTTDSADGKAMRNKEYKLIKFDYGAAEFYHLTTDTFETHNLLNDTLNATEFANYNYLCTQMGLLTGSNTFCQSVITPLSIIDYQLVIIDKKQIQNIWTTANEINVSHFNTQRSTNGKEFITIGQLKSNNGTENDYRFVDEKPNEGLNYYRIKSVDLDGKISYTATKKIVFNSKNNVTCFPNPAKDYITIQNKEFKQFKMIDNLGKVILINQLAINATQTIDISRISKGIYTLQYITRSGQTKTEKLIKD